MKILELHLQTADLPSIQAFYAHTLGLKTVFHTSERVGFRIGYSILVFHQINGFAGRYHLAFDVPNNQLELAKNWLESCTPLLTASDGTVIYHSDNWNSDQFYFLDPAGNILELIARHSADTACNTPDFSGQYLLAITEIGLASPDVPATVAWLQAQLGLPKYSNSSDSFTPIGDEAGLFIVVKAGREWFPSTGVAAIPLPVEVVIECTSAVTLQIPDLPYLLRVVVAQ
jgi:catechol-2,3-dioxygenase